MEPQRVYQSGISVTCARGLGVECACGQVLSGRALPAIGPRISGRAAQVIGRMRVDMVSMPFLAYEYVDMICVL